MASGLTKGKGITWLIAQCKFNTAMCFESRATVIQPWFRGLI
jgi:hypothetical protein